VCAGLWLYGGGIFVSGCSDQVPEHDFQVASSPSTFHILASEAAQSLATPNEEGDAATPEWFRPGAWHAFVGFEGTAEILARYSRDLTDYAEQSRAGKYVLVDETSAKFLRAGLPEDGSQFL